MLNVTRVKQAQKINKLAKKHHNYICPTVMISAIDTSCDLQIEHKLDTVFRHFDT